MRVTVGRVTKRLFAAAIAVGLVAATPASAVVSGANGKLLYTLQTSGNFDIWTINPDGSGNAPLVTDAANDQGGSWSPDGTKIVFRSDRTGAGDIYIANADGTNQLRLTNDPAQESHPSFSPDGTRIVFVRKDPDDEIFVMNVDGSDVQRRTNNTMVADAGPECSPDGSRIAYFSANVIYVMNADGSNQHELVPGGGSVGAQWSPDARRVLFNRNDGPGAGSHPYAVNADGTGLVNLGQMVPSSQAPSWSPDASKIVFLSAGPVGSDIWIDERRRQLAGPRSWTTHSSAAAHAGSRSRGHRWRCPSRRPNSRRYRRSSTGPSTRPSCIRRPTSFEFGITTAYGTRTPDAAAPAPVGAQAISADIAGLQPATEYHMRLLARNAIGTTTGGDATFRTPKATPLSLSVRVKPRRDRTLPFRYVFSGRLRLPTSVAASRGCSGRVTIQVKRGKRQVATRLARLSRSCRYRKVVSFRSTRRLRASKGRLRVTTTFRGNTVLSSKRGAPRVVRFG